jgi:hypothetical protein
MRVIVSVGTRSGQLTVVAASDKRLHGRRAVVCECACGSAPFLVRESHVRDGHTKSCGCANRTQSRSAVTSPVHDQTVADGI